ncbi:NYN domain-containing protein [Candidatus Oleimmundimicrobium sp.]|uniref:NYN domain-containing protein n=1 Tax=Candidatus Oleimmundimicrobium sp. TaxID=3060597 RepID=UPI0027166484|nr:NYN domain-containing protein [Candidatus Oleimmundimicrobium sp.]MDO8885973.1 NYN domain-containing protein [Candidatus Oleimmundimicrobium sp.]
MKELIIVDGYNVINQESRYRQLMGDLETARVKLIEDLANYGTVEECDVVVVFDASGGRDGFERRANIFGIDVFFTKKGQSADSFIEKFAYEAKRDKRVTVVTADYDQQKTVFSDGVLRKTPGEMVADIVESKVDFFGAKEVGPKKKFFLEDRLDEKVKKSLRRLIHNP